MNKLTWGFPGQRGGEGVSNQNTSVCERGIMDIFWNKMTEIDRIYLWNEDFQDEIDPELTQCVSGLQQIDRFPNLGDHWYLWYDKNLRWPVPFLQIVMCLCHEFNQHNLDFI